MKDYKKDVRLSFKILAKRGDRAANALPPRFNMPGSCVYDHPMRLSNVFATINLDH